MKDAHAARMAAAGPGVARDGNQTSETGLRALIIVPATSATSASGSRSQAMMA
jgi:hypothetical protein